MPDLTDFQFAAGVMAIALLLFIGLLCIITLAIEPAEGIDEERL
jgi:hypothetical protein